MTVQKLNHVAYRCRDAKETAEFYRDILGLKLAHVITQDRVPSTQELAPHCHLFFELGDGSWVAFFDLIDELEVDSVEVLEAARQNLVDHEVEVLGPVDHGFIRSIYFHDPSGHRLELATRTINPGELERFRADAPELVETWTRKKKERLGS
jgi:catechol 2,3-dioxygenase-like lactoylglutathione lyase family enzyme